MSNLYNNPRPVTSGDVEKEFEGVQQLLMTLTPDQQETLLAMVTLEILTNCNLHGIQAFMPVPEDEGGGVIELNIGATYAECKH